MAAVRGHQYFSLRWNNYQNTMTSVFQQLREDLSFVDVTLSCEHGSLKAHKVSEWNLSDSSSSKLLLFGSSSQGRPLRLLDVFPEAPAGESLQAPHHHPARRHHLHRPQDHHRLCLPRRDRCHRIGTTGESVPKGVNAGQAGLGDGSVNKE